MGKWKTNKKIIIHENQWVKFRVDSVIRPDGQYGEYSVLESKSKQVVVIVPFDKDGNTYILKVNRYPIGIDSWELPIGRADGEDIEAAAKRELFEETGLKAGKFSYIGYIHPLDGLVDVENHIFVATDLTQHQPSGQEEEGISSVKRVTLNELLTMIKNGEMTDGESISALFKVLVYLDQLSL